MNWFPCQKLIFSKVQTENVIPISKNGGYKKCWVCFIIKLYFLFKKRYHCEKNIYQFDGNVMLMFYLFIIYLFFMHQKPIFYLQKRFTIVDFVGIMNTKNKNDVFWHLLLLVQNIRKICLFDEQATLYITLVAFKARL